MAVSDGIAGDAPRPTAGVIVVAAGDSRRMAGVDKIFVPLMGRPLISYSLEVLQGAPQVRAIVLVLAMAGMVWAGIVLAAGAVATGCGA